MTVRSRGTTILLTAILVFLCLPPSTSSSAGAEEPEFLKGTIQKLEEGALFLMDVSFPDETIPRRDIRILVDQETRYFYGTKQIPKEEASVGHKVLVRCTLVGSNRKALMVRIIGGKKTEE